jgi:hypothetical protein
MIINTSLEFKLKLPNSKAIEIKRGINWIMRNQIGLKGGVQIPIHLKISGTERSLNVPENTSAIDLYYIATAWIGLNQNSIRIEICKIGELREWMGHILEPFDYIWNELYDFNWYRVHVLTKEFNTPNHSLIPSENIKVVINLGTNIICVRFFTDLVHQCIMISEEQICGYLLNKKLLVKKTTTEMVKLKLQSGITKQSKNRRRRYAEFRLVLDITITDEEKKVLDNNLI